MIKMTVSLYARKTLDIFKNYFGSQSMYLNVGPTYLKKYILKRPCAMKEYNSKQRMGNAHHKTEDI